MEETKSEVPMSEEECVTTPRHKLAAMQKRIDRGSKAVAAIIIILSTLLLVAIVAWMVLAIMDGEKNVNGQIVLLLVALFFLLFGIFFCANLRKNERFEARRAYEERIRFSKDYAEVMTYRRGEVISKEKLYYADLFAVRQKKNLLFIYVSSVAVHVVDLTKLRPADVATLHDYLRF